MRTNLRQANAKLADTIGETLAAFGDERKRDRAYIERHKTSAEKSLDILLQNRDADLARAKARFDEEQDSIRRTYQGVEDMLRDQLALHTQHLADMADDVTAVTGVAQPMTGVGTVATTSGAEPVAKPGLKAVK